MVHHVRGHTTCGDKSRAVVHHVWGYTTCGGTL